MRRAHRAFGASMLRALLYCVLLAGLSAGWLAMGRRGVRDHARPGPGSTRLLVRYARRRRLRAARRRQCVGSLVGRAKVEGVAFAVGATAGGEPGGPIGPVANVSLPVDR